MRIKLLITSLALMGCHGNPHTPIVQNMDELAPSVQNAHEQNLVLSGTPYRVKLIYRHIRDRLEIESMASGSILSREEYLETPFYFSLVAAEDDMFEPPVPLIEIPLAEGKPWNWQGKVVSFGHEMQGNATIAARQRVIQKGSNLIEVAVDLKLDSPSERPPIERKLRFDFMKGNGLVSREFGAVSKREPL